MAPRARGRKDTRMDAAIDGFDEKLVRSTVNDQLKVCKGKNRTLNPWRFIEEGCYTLLHEQLLEKVEAQDAAGNRDADQQDDNASQDGAPMQEDAALLEDAAPRDDAAPPDDASAAAPSSTAILSTCDNAPQDDGSVAGTSRTAIQMTHQLLRPQALPFYLLAIMLHKMMDQRLEPQGLPFYVLAQRLSTTQC